MTSAKRRKDGRGEETSLLILDSQSVKNTDTAEEKGYDGGKKISGIKRHVGVDSQGGELQAVDKVLVDGICNGQPFASFAHKTLGTEVEIAKRNERRKFEVIPKRRVVERSFAWLGRCTACGKTASASSPLHSPWCVWPSSHCCFAGPEA